MMAQDPLSMAVNAVTTVINDKLFGKLTATVKIESSLDAAVFKAGVEPQQVVVPIAEYGKPLVGVVELVAPPGVKLWFSELSVSLRVSKITKHGGEPEIKPEMKEMPKWMHPKATPIVHVYDPPIHASNAYTVLEKGQYEVLGTVRVPFSIPTDALPAMESYDSGDGTGLCHWVEAQVTTLGWLSKVQYARDCWDWLQENGAINRAEMKRKGGVGAALTAMQAQSPAAEGIFFQPGGRRGKPFQQLVMQVVSGATPLGAIYEPDAKLPPMDADLKPEEKEAAEAKLKANKQAQALLASHRQEKACKLSVTCSASDATPGAAPAVGVLSDIRAALCTGSGLTATFQLSGSDSLSRAQWELLTSLDGCEPVVSASAVLYDRELATLLAQPADPSDVADAADADAADAATTGGGSSPTSATSATSAAAQASTVASLQTGAPINARLDVVDGRQYMCSSYLQPAPLDGCIGPREAGAPYTSNPDQLTKRVDVQVRHSVRLVLTDLQGKEASSTCPILLLRKGLCGAPAGTLESGVPPPPPVPMAWWKKTALFLLGLMSTLIMLSFMMPVKFEWGVTALGLEETADFCGLLAPKNGTKQGWTRTVVATGTQSVKRFLTGHR